MENDLISIQDAVEALAELVPYAIDDDATRAYMDGLTDACDLICQLPSAQPEIDKDINVPVNDCISRQWLMECVNEGWIKFDTEKDENRFIHLVRDIAPTVQTEWIPCNERLPEEEKIYLVTYSNGIVGTSSWHKDTKCNLGFDGVMNGILDDGRIVVYGIIAWMPLPEPYQGGQ